MDKNEKSCKNYISDTKMYEKNMLEIFVTDFRDTSFHSWMHFYHFIYLFLQSFIRYDLMKNFKFLNEPVFLKNIFLKSFLN